MSLWRSLTDAVWEAAQKPVTLPWSQRSQEPAADPPPAAAPQASSPGGTSGTNIPVGQLVIRMDDRGVPSMTLNPSGRHLEEKSVNPSEARAMQVNPWEDGKPTYTDWTCSQAIIEGFKSSDWVYACIQKLATCISSMPIRMGVLNEDEEVVPVPGDPLTDLFREPSDFCDGQDLRERWTQHLLLCGNALGLKVRLNDRDRTVREIWPLQPDQIKPVKSRTGYISHYVWEAPGVQPIKIDVDDVIHIMIQDPANPFWGCSPLQALGKIVDTENDALTWWRMSIRNRAAKDGALTFKYELTEEQYLLIKAQLMEQALGPQNARLPWIIGNEAKFEAMSSSPVEMDFTESRKMCREEICAVFGIPLILFGLGEYSSFNNIITARLILWLDTVIPFAENVAAALNRAFRTERGGRLSRKVLYFDHSKVEALMGNYREKVLMLKDLCATGVPLNVAAKRLNMGLPNVKGGDEGYVSSALTPISSLTSLAAAGLAAAEAGAEALSAAAEGANDDGDDPADEEGDEEDTPQAGAAGKKVLPPGRRQLRREALRGR